MQLWLLEALLLQCEVNMTYSRPLSSISRQREAVEPGRYMRVGEQQQLQPYLCYINTGFISTLKSQVILLFCFVLQQTSFVSFHSVRCSVEIKPAAQRGGCLERSSIYFKKMVKQ